MYGKQAKNGSICEGKTTYEWKKFDLWRMRPMDQFFTILFLTLISIVVTYALKFFNLKSSQIISQCDNQQLANYLSLLTSIINDCVLATKQTYVDSLKDKNAFTADSQREAFNKTYEAVQKLLTDEAKVCLEKYYGDLDLYITERIEAQVQTTKE